MKLQKIIIRRLQMEMKFTFETSFGSFNQKDFLLLEAIDEYGRSGWGESVAFLTPWYTEETLKTNWHMLEDFIIPSLLHKEINHPDEVTKHLSFIKRNNMAKSTIEGAVWDLYSQSNELPLSTTLGGDKTKIEVGVSIGIQPTTLQLLKVIEKHVEEGYKRIKIKIKPGWDVNVVKEIRKEFPNVPLMGDANSAYTLNDISLFKQLDEYGLLMIEQPLGSDDIVDHSILQKQIQTPICLDESIHSYEGAKKAIELGSCKIINVKIGRVGGLTESKRIHDFCLENNVPIWCGGMLEAGIGRAHNIALASLTNFTLPGDTAASSRYWEQDIINPEVIVKDGYINVPNIPGIGYEINRSAVQKYTVEQKTYN